MSKTFPRGTLVMSIAANIGDVAILDFEACFPDSMVGLIPTHKTDLNFLYFMMRTMKGIMLRSAVISTQLNLNNVRIGTNFAAFPPIEEQIEIGEYLDTKEQEVQVVKETLNQQIATLTAYRKSLIHECVTGQRRITEADCAGQKRGVQHECRVIGTDRTTANSTVRKNRTVGEEAIMSTEKDTKLAVFEGRQIRKTFHEGNGGFPSSM